MVWCRTNCGAKVILHIWTTFNCLVLTMSRSSYHYWLEGWIVRLYLYQLSVSFRILIPLQWTDSWFMNKGAWICQINRCWCVNLDVILLLFPISCGNWDGCGQSWLHSSLPEVFMLSLFHHHYQWPDQYYLGLGLMVRSQVSLLHIHLLFYCSWYPLSHLCLLCIFPCFGLPSEMFTLLLERMVYSSSYFLLVVLLL